MAKKTKKTKTGPDRTLFPRGPFERKRPTWLEEVSLWTLRPDALFPEGYARTRHDDVLVRALSRSRAGCLGVALARAVLALAEYRDAYEVRYEMPITDDSVLGRSFAEAAQGLIGLLNGELSGLDAATMDTILRVLGGIEE